MPYIQGWLEEQKQYCENLTSIMDMCAASLDQGSHEEAEMRDLHLFQALQFSSLEMVHIGA